MLILGLHIMHDDIAIGESLPNGSLLPAKQLCERLRRCTDKIVVGSDAAANFIKLNRAM